VHQLNITKQQRQYLRASNLFGFRLLSQYMSELSLVVA
jgi:hypothetical protein